MLQKAIILLSLCLLTISQTAVISQPFMLGAYMTKTDQQLTALKANKDFTSIVTAVRQFWSTNMKESLGEVLQVEEQIVAGSNFRITFKVENRKYDEVEVVVFMQPWANLTRVIYTSPEIEGGLKDQDLSVTYTMSN